jgi:predicted 2-oxoglutarate/Fe(II)-dependent dioxygenase YbiX
VTDSQGHVFLPLANSLPILFFLVFLLFWNGWLLDSHSFLTQQYTAHHDFGYAAIDDKHMGARFSTLLFYLNTPEEGGETNFPRWVNAETFKDLKVKPEVGKAVLFYSQLPDGNMDDFSQHAALPVKKGEKWLINLWVSSLCFTL